jgi:hypothetical protein
MMMMMIMVMVNELSAGTREIMSHSYDIYLERNRERPQDIRYLSQRGRFSRRIASFGMLRRLGLIRTDVSEEPSVSIG